MIGSYIEKGRQQLAERGIQAVRGAETGTVVRRNREYLDSIEIEMRVLDSTEACDTAFEFLGKRFATPVMAAALSGLNNIRPKGMAVLARGVADAEACMWAGIGQEQELRDVIAAGAPTVKIIKPYRDNGLIFQKLRQAEDAGCFAVGMDIDFFFGGQVGDELVKPSLFSPKSSAQMRKFIEATRLPFILKGVLSERDAEKALELGAAAIVISHHSGSVMDFAVPPLRILPKLASLVQKRVPILVDGGLMHGSDVFKALALGADGVLVGRALLAGLELDGAEGVTKVIGGITEELRRIMCLTGARSLREIDASVLWLP